jgi:glycine cleavage system H protein
MNFPDNLRYTKDHEWIKSDGKEAVIGITEFAQSELGDIVYVDIETEGESLEAEAVFGTVEAVKTVSDLFMPVAAKVVSVNKNLVTNPAVVNKDPYGEGWMIRIEAVNPTDIDSLLSAADYRKMVGA